MYAGLPSKLREMNVLRRIWSFTAVGTTRALVESVVQGPETHTAGTRKVGM